MTQTKPDMLFKAWYISSVLRKCKLDTVV